MRGNVLSMVLGSCFMLLGVWANAQEDLVLPDFIAKEDVVDVDCKCLEKEVKYSKEEQKYIDILWEESMLYLRGLAEALTKNPEEGGCRQSDVAVFETLGGVKRMCIMDRRDMQLLVKQIYQILYNQDVAKKCFAARRNVDWLYSPGGKLEEQSPVAKWMKRTTFQEFFDTKVTNDSVKAYGKVLTDNFYDLVTGEQVVTPPNFPYDVSARSLPNLWASVGWFPMYAEDSERNKRNFMEVRGGYAYGEILGHWGLLRIDEIGGHKVGAEVGMTVQMVNSLYPYHNHSISEMYYTMTTPSCPDQFKTFAARDINKQVKTVGETADEWIVEFDAGMQNEFRQWSSGSNTKNNLVYFYENTIHAFDVDGSCVEDPEKMALVSVWARSDAHEIFNDYGGTRLCECADKPNTPAVRGKKVRCQVNKLSY